MPADLTERLLAFGLRPDGRDPVDAGMVLDREPPHVPGVDVCRSSSPEGGRGVYRAVVRARREAAVARGTPALVVQAEQMSRPILERLGFRAVCTIRALVDG
jgi:hypothetical protein